MNLFYKIFLFVVLLLGTFGARAQMKASPVHIIFDSDMGPDYDDVGAITILHALADKGEARILATMASTKYEGVAAVLNVLNTYFNRPDIPVGVPKGDALELRDFQHWTDTLLEKYPHDIKINEQAQDAVKLYRKILASQPDHSVTIVTIGFLTNLSNLLNTRPDVYSPLSGKELVRRKVKLLVSMGGRFPSGFEFNIMKDAAASKNVYEHWATPVILSGFEIGDKIKAGLPLINNPAITNSPVKDVFRIAIPMAAEDSAGRKSWDETAVLVAIRGYTKWYKLHYGTITVNADGGDFWEDKGILQSYLVEKADFKIVQDLINDLIMHQPVIQSMGLGSPTPKQQFTSVKSPSVKPKTASIQQKQNRISKVMSQIEKVRKMQEKVDRVEAKRRQAEKAEN